MDKFSIHMHKNRQKALEGLTKEEQIEYEKCIAYKHERTSPNLRRNAHVTYDQSELTFHKVWFEDEHSYLT